LPALLASNSGRRSASAALEVEEREVSQSGENAVGSQGFVVRQLFHLSALNPALIKNARTWIGQFHRATAPARFPGTFPRSGDYHTYIRGEVPFAHPRAKPARTCPYRRLAITPSRHPGPCLLFHRAIRTDVPVIDLKTLPTARLDTHCSRHPRTHLTTAVRAS
jgi:hypothetical protein